MNYFEFYKLPVSFLMDRELVRKKFFELSKKYHPDYYISENEKTQAEMLDLSTFNTKAFQTLSDFDRRMKYILELKDQVHENERHELPPDFLMSMMDINEGLMELKAEPDIEKISAYWASLSVLFDQLYEVVRSVIESYDDTTVTESDLKKIKDYYFKKKYLLRIKESLDTFAAHP